MGGRIRKKAHADGSAIVSRCRVRIPKEAYRAVPGLTHAELPRRVREIGDGAFADNPLLERITLPDTVAQMGSHVFANCPGLKEPVLNVSKTVLYHYPQSATERIFRVPWGVHTVETTAFGENPWLEEVVLPDTVTRLAYQAFCGSNIRCVTISSNVREIREKTFVGCSRLQKVILKGDTKIAPGAFPGAPDRLRILGPGGPFPTDEKFWAIGKTMLRAELGELPDGAHTKDPAFRILARGCGKGRAEHMWELGAYFDRLFAEQGHPFFSRAAAHWRYMACLNGVPEAKIWFNHWEAENPDTPIPAVLDESRSGKALDGRYWHYLGYLDIEPVCRYDVSPTGNAGITLVRRHPYEGGFWESGLYQTTYLDEYLNTLPVDSIFQHPSSEGSPDFKNPQLLRLMGSAVSASLERNSDKRKHPYFLKFG